MNLRWTIFWPSSRRSIWCLSRAIKGDAHPKVEAHRGATGNPLIAPGDPSVVAVASDVAIAIDRPVFDLDDTAALAEFILTEVGLMPARQGSL